MPHQCLNCGKVFETLTDDILFHGCPDCGRRKFTFTNEPLSDEERNGILKRREGEIRELIRRSQVDRAGEPSHGPDEEVKEVDEEEWVGISSEEAPEVIKVLEPGVYEINLEKLLEDSPIIINRDGSYMVYLPSIFKRKKKR